MKKSIILIVSSFLFVNISISQNNTNLYCGETPPKKEAKLFAPGFITTSLYTRDLAMTPDGKEIYFCVSSLGYNLIFFTKMQKNGKWSTPKPASFCTNPDYMYYEPCISQDGEKMLFLSNMPNDSVVSEDIWCVDRLGENWGEPYNLAQPINTLGAEFYPSLTIDGTLYFTRKPVGDPNHYIFRAKLGKDGKYLEPEKLPEQVNCGTARFNAYISPKEDFIIVPAVGMPDTYGATDYYIVFRNEKDEWSEPINMGDQINSAGRGEYSASLSYDGKYLFFMSDRKSDIEPDIKTLTIEQLIKMETEIQNGSANIYWISAEIINELKPDNFK
ncbi:MAG: PD40 domain-containing protein [Bacteroidales bacterium]|nr:PD40 domain-containing protein [Bacteroidales bacterium]